MVTEAKKEFQDDKARLANLETMLYNLNMSKESGGQGSGGNSKWRLVDPKGMIPDQYTHGGSLGCASWRDDIEVYCDSVKTGMKTSMQKARAQKEKMLDDFCPEETICD